MTSEITCTLCSSTAVFFHETGQRQYYKCSRCLSVLLNPSNYLSGEKEKRRYEEHNNDVEDPGYQKFVSPIVNQIKQSFTVNHKGLDFGAGPGPVITNLLQKEGFKIDLYDPYFWNNPHALKTSYDYIACCEVIEHFHSPKKEFALLKSLLKPGGTLYCMTEIYFEDIHFDRWYYKNDPTHVFFYHRQAFQWIKDSFNFSRLTINNRLIQLSN